MRKKIVAGNWKMNCTLPEAESLVEEILGFRLDLSPEKEVVLAVPFTYLTQVQKSIQNVPRFHLGAQNCHHEKFGAFTGEISATMLTSVGTEYVIIGHSERRQYFQESNSLLGSKVNMAIQSGLQPIFCVGESLQIRQMEQQMDWVERQLRESLFCLEEDHIRQVVIAYEPVWAIGTGLTASNSQAQTMHRHIRNLIEIQYGKRLSENISILYGGSCKPSNAPELFACEDVDGGLIGGASLIGADFASIINSL